MKKCLTEGCEKKVERKSDILCKKCNGEEKKKGIEIDFSKEIKMPLWAGLLIFAVGLLTGIII